MAEKLKSGASGKHTGVHPEVLKSLASQCAAMKADMDESRGELGAKIKDAEETHGIHRGAFKLALKLRNMEDAPRADFLRALNDYIDKMGLRAQADLFEEGGQDDRSLAKQTAEQWEADEQAERLEKLGRGKQAEPAVH